MKTGFSAYEEIQKLAKSAFHGQDVSVQASIFGDDYKIIVNGSTAVSGPTNPVRATLYQLNRKCICGHFHDGDVCDDCQCSIYSEVVS